jgi:rhomboid protease GluP
MGQDPTLPPITDSSRAPQWSERSTRLITDAIWETLADGRREVNRLDIAKALVRLNSGAESSHPAASRDRGERPRGWSFAPGLRELWRRAAAEAIYCKSPVIDTEHLLLAQLRSRDESTKFLTGALSTDVRSLRAAILAGLGPEVRADYEVAASWRRAPPPATTVTLVGLLLIGFVLALSPAGLAYVADSSAIARGQWYRLVTYMFLHLSAPHLAVNLVALLFVGWLAERALGSPWFLVVFLVSGVVGAATSFALGPCQLQVGASGATYGAFAGLVGHSLGHLRHPLIRRQLRLFAWLALAMVLVDLLRVDPGIDHLGHLGGLGAGLLLGLASGVADRRRGGVAAALLCVVVAGALVAWRSATFHC